MKTVSRTSILVFISALMWAHSAMADIYKCTGADGKTSYSEAPCSGAGTKEAQINAAPAAPSDAASTPATDWKAINAAANARGQAAMTPRNNSKVSINFMGRGTSQQGVASPKSNQQIIAECEANHGARCNTAQEINQRRMDDRTLSPTEEKARQEAVAARRYREQEQQEARWRALDQR